MAQQQQLEQLESEAIAIWEYLIAAVSTPAQLERLYLKVLVYLVAYFVNQASAIADTAKPAIFGGTATAYRTQVLKISPDISKPQNPKTKPASVKSRGFCFGVKV